MNFVFALEANSFLQDEGNRTLKVDDSAPIAVPPKPNGGPSQATYRIRKCGINKKGSHGRQVVIYTECR